MGFIPDVQQIIAATPPKRNRQTMLFSATLTPAVTRFASQWTRDPVLVEVEPEHVAVDTIDQVVYITTMEEKFPLLYNLVTREKLERVIVFGNRRDQTRQLMERFTQYGISSALLSGDVDQKKRIKTLEDFREGRIRVLVATDVAARGLHIDGVSHVVNYNLPMNPEDYVHRIGRTGRAGASGISISFASEDDSFQIPGIEKFLGRELNCVHPEEEWLVLPPPPAGSRRPPKRAEPPPRRPRRDGAPAFKPRNSRGRRSSS
jgi:ATP-dependent RNA helicase RhlB